MLNRYYEAENCKEDIRLFGKMVCSDTRIPPDKITCIAKNMLFCKRFFNFYVGLNKHYYGCMISDMLLLINSLSQNSVRNVYTTFRSLIENLIRVLLKYRDDNATGVRNMFSEFREDNEKEYVDYLEGEYGKCCDVVHSNCNFSLPMYSFYEELLAKDEIDENKINEYCDKLMSFFIRLKKYLISSKADEIWAAFQNNKEVLCVLIGKKDYDLLEEKVLSND